MIKKYFYRIQNLDYRLFAIVISCLLPLSACKKPGIGGEAKISGYVHVKKYNATFTQFLGEYPGKDLYVYIVFGNHNGYDKRIKTDYAGRFEFANLYKGDYTIYLYSRDSSLTDLSGIIPVTKQVLIEKFKSEVNLDTINIFQ
jgi:hypothetical protein